MDFERVDMREITEEEMTDAVKMAEIVFKLNHTMPNTEGYNKMRKQALANEIDTGTGNFTNKFVNQNKYV